MICEDFDNLDVFNFLFVVLMGFMLIVGGIIFVVLGIVEILWLLGVSIYLVFVLR